MTYWPDFLVPAFQPQTASLSSSASCLGPSLGYFCCLSSPLPFPGWLSLQPLLSPSDLCRRSSLGGLTGSLRPALAPPLTHPGPASSFQSFYYGWSWTPRCSYRCNVCSAAQTAHSQGPGLLGCSPPWPLGLRTHWLVVNANKWASEFRPYFQSKSNSGRGSCTCQRPQHLWSTRPGGNPREPPHAIPSGLNHEHTPSFVPQLCDLPWHQTHPKPQARRAAAAVPIPGGPRCLFLLLMGGITRKVLNPQRCHHKGFLQFRSPSLALVPCSPPHSVFSTHSKSYIPVEWEEHLFWGQKALCWKLGCLYSESAPMLEPLSHQ